MTTADTTKLGKIIGLIKEEYRKAVANPDNNTFNSFHEGWAVLKEELDELNDAEAILWKEVKKSKGVANTPNMDEMKKEATQVAAMAFRFLYDLCELEEMIK